MQPEITEFEKWVKVDGTAGIHWYLGQYFTMGEATKNYPGKVEDVELWRGYGARLSMPGYLDCTEWTVFDSRSDAAGYLLNMYFDYPADEMTHEDELWQETLECIENDAR